MLAGARRDLRRMGDGDHLQPLGEAGEPRPDGIGDRTADAGIDLIEDQRRRRSPWRRE